MSFGFFLEPIKACKGEGRSDGGEAHAERSGNSLCEGRFVVRRPRAKRPPARRCSLRAGVVIICGGKPSSVSPVVPASF